MHPMTYFFIGFWTAAIPLGVFWWLHTRELKRELNRHVIWPDRTELRRRYANYMFSSADRVQKTNDNSEH